MKKKIIKFEEIKLMPHVMNEKNPGSKCKEDKIKYFEENGFFNGVILTALNYRLVEQKLEIEYLEKRFFDFLDSENHLIENTPSISVNGVIDLDDSIILIKRGTDVYSYINWIDFPAGIVRGGDELQERLLERIYSDTGIEKENLKFKRMLPLAILLDDIALNFFYHLEYSGSREQLLKVFSEKESPPLIIKKDTINEFVSKNPIVFPEVLKFLY